MIESVTLVNWKAFERVSVDFEDACVFVLSPNAVGKTSLLQGVMFALFGTHAHAVDAARCLRFGRRAEVDVRLRFAGDSVSSCETEDAVVRVRRAVTPKPRGGVTIESTIRLEQAPPEVVTQFAQLRDDALLDALMQRYWGAPAALASKLLFMNDSVVWEHRDRELRLNWMTQIERMLGLTALRNASEAAAPLAKRTLREADALRLTARREADSVEALRRRAEEVRHELEAVKNSLVSAESAIAARATKEAYERELVAFNARLAHHERALEAARAQLVELLGDLHLDTASLQEAHSRALAEIRSQMESLQQRRGRALAERDLLESNADLVAASDECPVCLRPFDDHAREQAHAAHADRRRSVEAALADAEQEAASLALLEDKLLTVEIPGDAPVAPIRPIIDLSEVADVPASDLDELRERRVALDVELRSLNAEIADAESGADAFDQARALYRRHALAVALAEAAEMSVSNLVDMHLEPIRREVQDRWSRLWPGREQLILSDDGDVSLVVDGNELDYESFSGGQKTIALIMMRIVVLQTLTRCRMLILDEPLEHLDPRHRKIVANLLADVVSRRGMRQIIATTYEENIVRGLVERARLIAVRGGVTDVQPNSVRSMYLGSRALGA
ncbi:MAG TPA: AAA family ATPase [Frankiaceae bacterium]|nr:AAA family ATPase [Frankiaceae bacterium]